MISNWSTSLRFEIEARLLGNELLASISRKTSVSAAVLELFRLLFFDVMDRLMRPGFVLHQVIGPRAQTVWTDTDIQTVGGKLFGFHQTRSS